jgi:hypothetical protein
MPLESAVRLAWALSGPGLLPCATLGGCGCAEAYCAFCRAPRGKVGIAPARTIRHQGPARDAASYAPAVPAALNCIRAHATVTGLFPTLGSLGHLRSVAARSLLPVIACGDQRPGGIRDIAPPATRSDAVEWRLAAAESHLPPSGPPTRHGGSKSDASDDPDGRPSGRRRRVAKVRVRALCPASGRKAALSAYRPMTRRVTCGA